MLRPREQRRSLNGGWPLEPVTHNVMLLLHPPFTPTVTPTVTSGRAGLHARYVTVTPAVTALRAVTPTVTPMANWSEGLHCALVSSGAA